MSDNLINFFPCNYTVSCIVTATIIATDFVAKKKYAWHFIFEPRLCALLWSQIRHNSHNLSHAVIAVPISTN